MKSKILSEKKKLPGSNFEETVTNAQAHTQVRTVFVCSLCLEEYGATAELRQHMIDEHQYEDDVGDNEDITGASECINKRANVQNGQQDAVEEIRSMAFRDFRCLLRAPLVLRCSVAFACSYKFVNADKLAVHARCHITCDTEKGQAAFRCCHCGVDFNHWRPCSQHMWQQHQIDVDMLKCPICDFKAPTSVRVWRHMRFHSKWRPRVMRSLKAVKKRQNQKKLETMDTATMQPSAEPAASPAAALTQTTNVSQRSKYYAEKICEICDRKFVNGKTLSKHVKTVHNKIKPFICTVCGLKTARKASLMVHMRQHTGEKPLHCTICKFSTRDPSALHKHQSRHQEGGSKFKCKVCPYSCIQTNAYKRHMRLKHPTEYKRIACDLCTYVTINEDRLVAHKEDHRKGLITNCEDSMDDTRTGRFKYPKKIRDKHNDMSVDCFMPLESIDSLPHEPAEDTGGVTIPAPTTEDTQFPMYLNN